LKNKSNIAAVITPVMIIFILLVIWELLTRFLHIPRWILPGPIAVFKEAIVSFKDFAPHILVSLTAMIAGYIIAVPIGIAISMLLSNFKIADDAFTPYIIFIITTPMVTLVPLLLLWLGVGIIPKLIAVAIQCVGIIMLNSSTGFNNVPTIRLELMKSFRASRFTTFMRAVLPSGLPFVFTGLKLGAIFAITTTIGAEFVAGNTGLGAQIIKNTQFIQTEKAFACIVFVAIIGSSLYSLVVLAEKLVIRWKV